MCQQKPPFGEVTTSQKLWLIFKRSVFGRLLKKIKHRMITNPGGKKGKYVQKNSPSLELQPGDIVEVLSREEILKTLDRHNRCGGLNFMEPMWQYCGGKFKVYKRVEKIFDEGVVKTLHNTVILEGLICNGAEEFKDCDKSCFFFWKEDWLKKEN